jgi:hypothetical protein
LFLGVIGNRDDRIASHAILLQQTRVVAPHFPNCQMRVREEEEIMNRRDASCFAGWNYQRSW